MKEMSIKKEKALIGIILGIVEFIAVFFCIVVPAMFANGILLFAHYERPAKEGQIKVACVGDSITYGHGVKGWVDNQYPVVLNKLLGDEYCVNNYGYSDRTLLSTGNKPYRDEKLYQQSLDFNPDILVIMLGTNDTKPMNWIDEDTYVNEYIEMINSYKNLPSNPMVYIMCPPRTADAALLRNDIVKNEIHNGVIRVAAATGATVIDLYPVFEAAEGNMYYMDKIHPNDKGAALIAETVYSYLI